MKEFEMLQEELNEMKENANKNIFARMSKEEAEPYMPIMMVLAGEAIDAENKCSWMGDFIRPYYLDDLRKSVKYHLDFMEATLSKAEEGSEAEVYKLIDLARINYLKSKSTKELYNSVVEMEATRKRIKAIVSSIAYSIENLRLEEKFGYFLTLAYLDFVNTAIKRIKEDIKFGEEEKEEDLEVKKVEVKKIYTGAYVITEHRKDRGRKIILVHPGKFKLVVIRVKKDGTVKLKLDI